MLAGICTWLAGNPSQNRVAPNRRPAAVPQRTPPTAVAEILARISSLQTPEELEELTDGLLAIRASRVAPVLSGEETRLLLAINEGVSAELRDRVASLIEKRNNRGLSTAESHELTQLADKVDAGVWSDLRRCRDWRNYAVSRSAN